MRVLFIVNGDPRQRYRFLHDPLAEIGVDVSVVDGSRSLFPALVRVIKALLKKPRAEVVILTGGDIRNFIWFSASLLLTRSKLVLRFGGDPLEVRNSVERGFLARRNLLDFLRSYAGKSLTKIMLKHVHAVVVVSDYLLQNMRPALGRNTSTLVLAPTIKTPETASDNIVESGNSEIFNLLTVTNLNYREKADGVIAIAEAIVRLEEKLPSSVKIRYDIVGGGYQLDYLQRAIAEKCRDHNSEITVHGKLNNVAEFYRRADIFVYCSTLDGYPLVLCEAQSFGLPIVVNRWGAFPDMLNQDLDALFFDSGNIEELGSILARLVSDAPLRKKLGQGALANFEKKNSLVECGTRLKQFLQTLT